MFFEVRRKIFKTKVKTLGNTTTRETDKKLDDKMGQNWRTVHRFSTKKSKCLFSNLLNYLLFRARCLGALPCRRKGYSTHTMRIFWLKLEELSVAEFPLKVYCFKVTMKTLLSKADFLTISNLRVKYFVLFPSMPSVLAANFARELFQDKMGIKAKKDEALARWKVTKFYHHFKNLFLSKKSQPKEHLNFRNKTTTSRKTTKKL